MKNQSEYNIENVNLTDNEYTIKNSYIREKYEIEDSDGNVVLRGKQEMYTLKDNFPFVTEDGTDAFSVKSQSMIDGLGMYTLVDGKTQDEVVVMHKQPTFADNWNIRELEDDGFYELGNSESRDQDGGILETIRDMSALERDSDILATIEAKGKWVPIARSMVSFVPNKYEILDADGNSIGEINGKLSIRGKYNVSINHTHDTPTEAIIAFACVIGAIND